jgi:hypothetical protein
MCIFYVNILEVLCINAYIFKGLLGHKNPLATYNCGDRAMALLTLHHAPTLTTFALVNHVQ